MTKRSAVAGWVLVGVLSMCMGASGNLLQNPSFEDPEMQTDNPYGDIAAYWGRWGHWMNREMGWKPTRSGKCLMGYHHWQIDNADTSGFYQDVDDVAEGATCVFSVHVSKDRDSNVASVELRIEKTGGFETLGSAVYSMNDIKGTGYTQLSVTGRAVEDGVRVAVVVTPAKSGPRNGALKFDDAMLTAE